MNTHYGDCRDIGHVLSYNGLLESRADRAIYHYADTKFAFWMLRNVVEDVANF